MAHSRIDHHKPRISPLENPIGPPSQNGQPAVKKERQQGRLLSLLIRMGDRYAKSGNPNQALDLFFSIIEEHPDSSQAAEAKDRLIAICEQFEKDGLMHHARALYERLLD